MNFWSWLTRHRRERELDEELEAHLAMAIRDRTERGEDAKSAESAARREFGNRTLVKETTREMWGWNFLSGLSQDANYALRGMRRNPVFTAVAVLSLALGFGANTAIFSLMNTVMLRLLPVQHPEELVEFLQQYPAEPRGNGAWSWKSYEHFLKDNRTFADLFGTSTDYRVRLKSPDAPNSIGVGEYVTSNYFEVLGVRPAIGRFIGAQDVSNTATGAVAVLSWSCWTNRFHQDPEVLGKQISVQDVPAPIIGVTPRAFTGLRLEAHTDVWLPRPSSSEGPMGIFGRLKPGATIEQARAEMAVLFRFTIDERSAKSKDPLVRQIKMELEPAATGSAGVRDRFGKPLLVLMSIVGLLLLITCVNIATMLLARGAGRDREMAVRSGLGASGFRLLRHVFTESALLSCLGTLLGIFLAYVGTSALVRALRSGRPLERAELEVQPDFHVLLFVAGIAAFTALLFGLAPALSAFRTTPAAVLRPHSSAGETLFRRMFGRGLVTAQVALSVLLLSLAALFILHLWNLEHIDLGFRKDHALLVTLDPSQSGSNTAPMPAAYQELLNRLEHVPGVRSASLGAPSPLSGAGASGFANVEGFQERPADRRWISIAYTAPKYFATLGMPLLAGRDFDSRDREHPQVAIINQTMARYYFANRDPLGKRITMYHVTLDHEERTYRVIGVVGNANYVDIREAPRRTIYLPALRDKNVLAQHLILRTNINPEHVAGDVRHTVAEVLKTIPVTQMITLTDQIDSSMVPERLIATLSGFFASLAVLLAGIGLYGLLAYTVTRRTSEIGVRLALGATPTAVARMILGETISLVLAGLVLGIPTAFGGRALVARFMQDITVHAAGPLVTGAIVIVGGALLASYVPVRRASRVDPVEALRHE
jgi:putative ABC transport system permease protein